MDFVPSGHAENDRFAIRSVYDKVVRCSQRYIECINTFSHGVTFRENSDCSPDLKYYENTKEMLLLLKKFRLYILYTDFNTNADTLAMLDECIKRLASVLKSSVLREHSSVGLPNDMTFGSMNLINSANGICMKLKEIISGYVDIRSENFCFADGAWPENHVLVGSLRNQKQLGICLEYNFYHIPCELVEDAEAVKCIALYQSKNQFGDNAGISFYGKVISFEKLRRCEIKESESKSAEMYYRFRVEKWKRLRTQIRADTMGKLCHFTNLYLLLNSSVTSTLQLETQTEFELYRFMNSCAYTKIQNELLLKSAKIVYRDFYFEISNNKIKPFKISCDDFYKNRVSKVQAISRIIKN